jgi:hypothetical protein
MYALTNIKFNGEFIDQGTAVDESKFGEYAEGLIAAGALGPMPPGIKSDSAAAGEIAQRDQEIARLKDELAIMQGQSTPNVDDDARQRELEEARAEAENLRAQLAALEAMQNEARNDEGGDDGFDPSEHSVDEVVEFAQAHPDEVGSLLAAEQSGQKRVTLIAKLEALSAQS